MEGQIRKIVLSESGDVLLVPDIPEHCRDRKGMFDLKNNEKLINTVSGFPNCLYTIGHSCGGNFKFTRISKTHNILACNKCYARIVIPKKVITFYDLDKWLKHNS